MDFQRQPPLPELADAIDHLWWLEGEGDGSAQPVLPDGCMEWVFQLADPFEQLDATGHWQRQGRCLLVGQQLCAVHLRPGPRVRCLGVHWKPAGMAAFVAGDLRAHTGRIAPLPGVEALHRRLRAGGSFAEAADTLQRWLRPRRIGPADPRLAEAAHALQQGELALPQLAARLGLSERQLRRRFETAVGLAPKRYARLLRFQQVLAAGRAEDAGAWAAVAAEGGYCDQAHFNRDFRAFTGQRPRELLRDLGPLTAFFLAVSETSKTVTRAAR